MSERDALLRTIREHPEDDAPRLVFADWLDERPGRGAATDREWAAAIRQAIDVVRLPRSDPRYLEVRRDNSTANPPRSTLKRLPQSLRRFATFSRGLPDGLALSHRTLLKVADHLTDGTGPLYRLQLSQCRRDPSDLLACPGLRQFRHLSFANGSLNDTPATSLGGSPHLENLTSLSLPFVREGDANVSAIVTSPHLSGLRELVLGNQVDLASLVALAGSPAMTNLEQLSLNLGGLRIGLEVLAHSPYLGKLRRLESLRGTDGGLRALADGCLPSLTELRISCGSDANSAFGEFVRSPRFATMGALTVFGCFTESVWQGVPDHPGPAHLRLWYHTEHGDGFGAFVRSPLLGRCVELTISNPHRLIDHLGVLARSPTACHLRYLRIIPWTTPESLRLPAEVLSALAESPYLTNLVALSFGPFELDDDDLDVLEGATFAGSLRALGWYGDRVSVGRLERLATSPAFGRLIALLPGRRQSDPERVTAVLAERFRAPCYDW